ncbi:class I SAM-dependent methyltransferase [Sulfurovum sp. XTW-4]|uniref:Class I SAM-dependent methyltransferase n=1 Tax=Sulfurovum xiamenensis TaxID=3019066 RepID=A0ABT7QSA2_9BACT|nr:class I SAM-dependent methyltransferase [Sulfurovum xiamenensis]MDM5263931.1 class I SAM-dependent methyltransferase [Sulfurovum xiamenensis]
MANSTSDSLDLYAKVEDLLGVKEAAPSLYAYYLLFLNTIDFETLLDVGCGSGDFLRQIQGALEIPEVKGIDLSPLMVSRTLEQGYDAQCVDLCDLDGQYDVVTAVFDMVNYLDKAELERFLGCVKAHLNDGGYFLCDINTLHGFENVAVGSYIVDDEERFLTVDSDFEEGEYHAEFTLFEKEGTYFKKSQETIRQYYHTIDEIVRLSGLELVQSDDVNLYELEEADKAFLVLRKV